MLLTINITETFENTKQMQVMISWPKLAHARDTWHRVPPGQADVNAGDSEGDSPLAHARVSAGRK